VEAMMSQLTSEKAPTTMTLNPKGVAKMMEGYGRCLAMYQRVETMLKLLLPHLLTPGQPLSGHIAADWRSLLDSKETLGGLIQKYSGKVVPNDPESFEHYLKKLVANRNNLVHHFFATPIGNPRSDEELRQAIAHLVSQMEFVQPFMVALESCMHEFAFELEKSIWTEEQAAANENR
jgi:hypothetical protein